MKQQVTQVAKPESPLPVEEWYPSPKHQYPQTVYVPVPALSDPQAVSGLPHPGSVVLQPQQVPAQPHGYWHPLTGVSPAPQYHPGYQGVIPSPQTVTPQQYMAVPQYQYVPRPWGNVPSTSSRRQANPVAGSWHSGNGLTPWQVPADSAGYSGAPGGYQGVVPYGVVPGGGFTQHVW